MVGPGEDKESLAPGGPATYFAPAGRETIEGLRGSTALVRAAPLLQAAIDAMPAMVVILNKHRQIVAVNRAMLTVLAAETDDVLGKRPGEVVGCTHCHDGPDGCGTGQFCITCGAVMAVLRSQESGGQAIEECRLTARTPAGDAAMDFRVTATAVELDGSRFTLCAIEDVSDRKRLAVLNRIFFHDVLNTVAGVRYFVDAAARTPGANPAELGRLAGMVDQLADEIRAQQDLILAESGDLEVDPEPVQIAELVEQLQSLYTTRAVASGRSVRWEDVWDGRILTDLRLLKRVLGNMLTNALEATEPGGTVRAACVERGRGVLFRVRNAAVMPEQVRLQIFQRSFSTKNEVGRGIGTHSIKLLGERYLRGKVAFTSKEPEGTTFTIALPKVLVPTPREGGQFPD